MNTLTHKLNQLEKNTVNSQPDPTETYLWVNNEAEQTLYKYAHDIIAYKQEQLEHLKARQKIHPTKDPTTEEETITTLSEEQEAIMQQVERLSFQRVFHVFERAIAVRYHQNNPECRALFMVRFFWFLSEINDMIKHIQWEQQITNEPKFYDLCKDEQEKKLNPCMTSWREWFTPESYHNYLKTLSNAEPKIMV